MAYDEGLAERMRAHFEEAHDVVEKKMFGGLCFMVAGHMAVGIIGEDLMVRVGKEAHAEAMSRAHARPMDFTGRVSKGMVYVGPEGTAEDEALASWMALGTAHARSLPPR